MSTRWVLAAAAAGGAVLGAAAGPVARLAGQVVPWQVTVPAGLAVGLLVGLAAALPASASGALEPPADRATTTAAAPGDLAALHFAVQAAARDPDRFETRLRPRLCEVAVDRLWLRHGLDWRADADRPAARAALGPDLSALLTAPPHTLGLTPRSLAGWLDELENL